MNKVVVTGIGLVTPLGFGREKTWSELLSGKSAISPDNSNHGMLCAEVKNFPVPKEVRLTSMAFLAASEAIKDSNPEGVLPENFGCTVSVSKPNLGASDSNKINFSEIFLQSTLGEQLYRIFRLKGPLQNIVAACVTGTHSVILAAEWIEKGICDMVLAGACESSMYPLYLAGFKSMGVLAKKTVSPFDKKREGFAIGEGAGIFVLENKQKAVMRGAKIYGEISGWAMSNNVCGSVAFNSEGKVISQAIDKALVKSGSDKVDYINAHGTATKLNDHIETKAIKKSFGKKTESIPVSSTKAATGHLLGASGAVELAFCLLALRDHVVPPTLNLHNPDPECDLDYTPNKSRSMLMQRAMSLSFGFGGQIGVLIVNK
ncbi:MAG: beta-ketoacyl-[acyl-carrier-protein] synthase family protein [Endomicrobiales bacterium]|nr:beta-ketoacyl-[acyl-carrier-protein] synthase family protein [Endomicrobiales bacterium]